MTVTALTGLVPEWFTPKDEEDEDEQTKFKLHPLTTPQMAQIQVHYNVEAQRIVATGLYLACQFGVKDWENLLDHEGHQMKFSKASLDVVPIELIAELGARILAMSVLTGEEEKNL